jgi:hypothetical protein
MEGFCFHPKEGRSSPPSDGMSPCEAARLSGGGQQLLSVGKLGHGETKMAVFLYIFPKQV